MGFDLKEYHILGSRTNLTKMGVYANYAKSIPTEYSAELIAGFGDLIERYAPKPKYSENLANALASLYQVAGCRKYVEDVIFDLKAKYPKY